MLDCLTTLLKHLQLARFLRNGVLVPAILAATGAVAHADNLTGQVVGIVDGDTLTLLADRRTYTIRLSGIDAPERHQAWGNQAKTNLSRLAMNQTAVADCPKLDRWGRRVCKLTVGATDVGLEQVRDGMAWWYKRYANDQPVEDRAVYENAELMAKLTRTGLWRDTNPVPPWEFRREH